ncbi:hypothetical protein FRACYDRAFT_252802 [Fragilariopsis cylindrus CCMP1102]|uniref:Transmembrane protein n=1 Tax=Fragilariopsis cylindrus CCMP1102 TaxID=635003 RepID=A0A1E7EM02_9STRA|nr:hypothetical protein FRACYDRAFT_252802 [Fragilariopsis cylindrus CCMP1102]|eukprot:OEU06876.1 hypothetical protein FRACYDRAFT_252802 [Fragilariopsis cylindrus CCMP1102]
MWLKSKLNFGVGGMHKNNHIFEQNASRKFLFGMVPKENSLLSKLNFGVGGMHANVVIFLGKMHEEISHPTWFQRKTLFWLGAVASTKCMRTLCYPPTTFLFLWLKRKLNFGVGGFELTMTTVLITVAVLTVRDQRQAISVDVDLLK